MANTPSSPTFPAWIAASLGVVMVLGAALWWVSGGDAPTMVQRPTVSGTAMVEQGLSADEGAWENAQQFSFQWERCAVQVEEVTDVPGALQEIEEETGRIRQESALSCELIVEGVGRTHRIDSNDAGARLRVVVTARNRHGSTAAMSEPTEVIVPLPPAVAEVPSVVGLPRSEAMALLAGRDLQPLPVVSQTAEAMGCDPVVTGQAPPSGGTLEIGGTVAITVPPVDPACF